MKQIVKSFTKQEYPRFEQFCVRIKNGLFNNFKKKDIIDIIWSMQKIIIRAFRKLYRNTGKSTGEYW